MLFEPFGPHISFLSYLFRFRLKYNAFYWKRVAFFISSSCSYCLTLPLSLLFDHFFLTQLLISLLSGYGIIVWNIGEGKCRRKTHWLVTTDPAFLPCTVNLRFPHNRGVIDTGSRGVLRSQWEHINRPIATTIEFSNPAFWSASPGNSELVWQYNEFLSELIAWYFRACTMFSKSSTCFTYTCHLFVFLSCNYPRADIILSYHQLRR